MQEGFIALRPGPGDPQVSSGARPALFAAEECNLFLQP
jgi:hypothetical protein